MNLDALKNALAGSDLASLTDTQAAERLNATTTVPCSRFGSLRTLANLLSADEYDVLRAALDQAAQGSRLLADMIHMLELPGDEQGSGGGIDFGAPAVQTIVGQLCSPATAAKIVGYATSTTSWAAQNGFPGGVSRLLVAQIRGRTKPT